MRKANDPSHFQDGFSPRDGRRAGEETLARDEEEVFAPKKAPARHELGQPLDALSVDELGERIELLRAEIARLEAARENKSASRTAADAFFRKPS